MEDAVYTSGQDYTNILYNFNNCKLMHTQLRKFIAFIIIIYLILDVFIFIWIIYIYGHIYLIEKIYYHVEKILLYRICIVYYNHIICI